MAYMLEASALESLMLPALVVSVPNIVVNRQF